jgi:polysaccharide pyruvyl transferase WcaK-like protein
LSTLITNAYSSLNLGDGLLVDESRDIVAEAGFIPTALLALDPGSFRNSGIHLLNAEASRKRLVLELGLGILPLNELAIERAFAVGGGYLRFPNRQVAYKTYLSHMTQLKILSKQGIPFALLPASIGPINFLKKEVLKILAKAEFIAVRDDKSVLELQEISNVYRFPDLSVLNEIKPISAVSGNWGVGLILRNLDFPNWLRDLHRIMQIENSYLMIQSSTGSSNNDVKFIIEHFPESEKVTTTEAFLIKRPSLVISSRLHGAIMSIKEGIPAIHLGYERKSFGVYEDLGLSEFCLPANNLDFNLLQGMVSRFQTDRGYSEHYFDCIARTNEARLNSRRNLVGLISCVN